MTGRKHTTAVSIEGLPIAETVVEMRLTCMIGATAPDNARSDWWAIITPDPGDMG